MSDTTRLDIGRIMDLAVEGGLKDHLEFSEDGVLVDKRATETIKRLKAAQELLQAAEKSIKSQFLDFGNEYGVREFNSNELNVALKLAVQFNVMSGYIRQWSKIKVNYTPNNEVIEAFMRLNDTLPEGVEMVDKTPVVQFKIKELA